MPDMVLSFVAESSLETHRTGCMTSQSAIRRQHRCIKGAPCQRCQPYAGTRVLATEQAQVSAILRCAFHALCEESRLEDKDGASHL